MPKNAGQKIKLLMLYDILQRETDEEHPLSTEELIEKLREKGIEAAPRVLPRDISLLNEYSFEVLSYKKKSYYYYVAYRRFDTAELRVLIDAVQAANFIPEAHTEDLARRKPTRKIWQGALRDWRGNIVRSCSADRRSVLILPRRTI